MFPRRKRAKTEEKLPSRNSEGAPRFVNYAPLELERFFREFEDLMLVKKINLGHWKYVVTRFIPKSDKRQWKALRDDDDWTEGWEEYRKKVTKALSPKYGTDIPANAAYPSRDFAALALATVP